MDGSKKHIGRGKIKWTVFIKQDTQRYRTSLSVREHVCVFRASGEFRRTKIVRIECVCVCAAIIIGSQKPYLSSATFYVRFVYRRRTHKPFHCVSIILVFGLHCMREREIDRVFYIYRKCNMTTREEHIDGG